jgi:hypothetical protein
VTDTSLSEFDPGYGLRREFAAMARQHGRLLNERSHAQIKGAQNLLTKAVRALASGDTQRAEQLVQRAAQMPYDAREAGSPGVHGASMLVYLRISDQFEASAADDPSWLDAPLHVHPDLDPVGQAEVASVVHGLVLQGTLFAVSPAEKRLIQKAFGGAPLNADLGDAPEATVEQRRDIIRSLVRTALALDEAYANRAQAR